MNHTLRLVLILVSLLFGASTYQQAQAVTVLYVQAGASGDCSEASPCGSFAAAFARQRSNVTIRVAPGVYREYVAIQNTTGVTIEADRAILSGFTALTVSPSGGGIYSAAWSSPVSTSGNPWPADVRLTWAGSVNTHVWADGARLSPSQSTPGVGQFQIAGGRLNVRSETAVESVLIATRGTGLHILSSNNITIRGLSVEGCSSAVANGCLVVRSSGNVTIENVDVSRSAYVGLHIDRSQDVVIRNISGKHNGARAFGVNESQRVTLHGLRSEDNGWRVALNGGNLTGWDGGLKIFRCTAQCEFRDVQNIRQFGPGFWIDFRNEALVDNLLVDGATLAGLFVEANREPVIVRNATIRNVPAINNDYWDSVLITGTNGARFENLRVEGGGITMTNPVRAVDGVNTNQHGNTFSGVRVINAPGYVFSILGDTTGYAQTTRITDLLYSGGSAAPFRRDGKAMTTAQFFGGLAQPSGGGILTSPTLTSTPTMTHTNTPTLTSTPTATTTPTPSPTRTEIPFPTATETEVPTLTPETRSGRLRIIIEIFWQYQED